MLIDIRTDDRNADAFLKWLTNWPREAFEDLPIDVLYFIHAVEDSVVR